MLSVIMLSVITLNVHAECHYAACHYAACHYTEYHYSEGHYAEFHCADCCYAECRSAEKILAFIPSTRLGLKCFYEPKHSSLLLQKSLGRSMRVVQDEKTPLFKISSLSLFLTETWSVCLWECSTKEL